MDVVTAEQALVAGKAGACTVMAAEVSKELGEPMVGRQVQDILAAELLAERG